MTPKPSKSHTTNLTPRQAAQLERLRHYLTRYEVEMVAPTGERWLVAYTPRRSFRGLIDVVHQRSEHVLRVADLPPDTAGKRVGAALHLPNGFVIRFSGRTQRGAIVAGELPYVGGHSQCSGCADEE